MAKKSASSGFREVITDIRAGKFSPVYILMGEEDYYIDKLVEELENRVLTEEEKDFNATTFYGADADIRQVMAKAQQYPVMAERQLVILKEAQTLLNSRSTLDKLAPYITHPNKSTVFVITYKSDPIPASAAIMKAADPVNCVVFKSEKLRDYQLSGPVADYCRDKRVSIDDKAIALLCEYIGSPLSKLFGEVDKLIVAAGSEAKITAELIESIIGISKDYNTFELIRSISSRDYPSSIRILTYFSKNPKDNPGVMVLATLFNFFSKLFIAAISKDKSDSALMQELGLKSSYALSDYRNGLRNYKAGAIDAIIHSIREYDGKSKGIGSTQKEYDLLRELIFKIFTLR